MSSSPIYIYLWAVRNDHIIVNALASAQCTDAHGVDVDVSINDDRGIRAARWLLRCQKQWPALRPLTLLLKAIMRVLELHDVSQGVYGHIVKSYPYWLLCCM